VVEGCERQHVVCAAAVLVVQMLRGLSTGEVLQSLHARWVDIDMQLALRGHVVDGVLAEHCFLVVAQRSEGRDERARRCERVSIHSMRGARMSHTGCRRRGHDAVSIHGSVGVPTDCLLRRDRARRATGMQATALRQHRLFFLDVCDGILVRRAATAAIAVAVVALVRTASTEAAALLAALDGGVFACKCGFEGASLARDALLQRADGAVVGFPACATMCEISVLYGDK